MIGASQQEMKGVCKACSSKLTSGNSGEASIAHDLCTKCYLKGINTSDVSLSQIEVVSDSDDNGEVMVCQKDDISISSVVRKITCLIKNHASENLASSSSSDGLKDKLMAAIHDNLERMFNKPKTPDVPVTEMLTTLDKLKQYVERLDANISLMGSSVNTIEGNINNKLSLVLDRL